MTGIMLLALLLCTTHLMHRTHAFASHRCCIRGKASEWRSFRPLTSSPASQVPDGVDVGPGTDVFSQRPRKRDTVGSFLASAWAFTRPHTIIGSAISIMALYAYATPRALLGSRAFFAALCEAALPACLMNVYITGLNQLTDVKIDKINKPYLPLASGELSIRAGMVIVVLCLAFAVRAAFTAAWPLQYTLLGSGLLGTVYSLPPFRLKRFPFLAALCILVVRGSLINMGFLLQAQHCLGGGVSPSPLQAAYDYPAAMGITAFFAVFGIVIAFMKDVPDIQGDQIEP